MVILSAADPDPNIGLAHLLNKFFTLANRAGHIALSDREGAMSGSCTIFFWAYGSHVSGMMLSGKIYVVPITLGNITTSVGPKGNGISTRGYPLAVREHKMANSGGKNDS